MSVGVIYQMAFWHTFLYYYILLVSLLYKKLSLPFWLFFVIIYWILENCT